MRAKHSFGMIIHNGSAFVKQVLESVYAFAHDIVIIEGSEPAAAFMATPEGGSVDQTIEVIRDFPDPMHKITLVQGGKFSNKTAQCNEYMRRVTGDYIWELDSDEVYRHEHLLALDRLLVEGQYEAVEIPFLHFWRDAYHIAKGYWWEVPIRRIFKREPGDLYRSHRPPELVRKPWLSMKLLTGDELKTRGIYCYHYGFVDNQRTKWKIAYHCSRGYKWEDHFEQTFLGNTGGHYLAREDKNYGVSDFSGPQPASILSSSWGRKKRVSVLHVLPSWSRGGGCTCIRHLIYCSNLGYYDHGVYVPEYKGVSPFHAAIPFHTKDFLRVASQYNVVEFMFWHSTRELTSFVEAGMSKQRMVVVIPIYNDNSLRMYFDRFYLSDAEKRRADHVVFMTDKAIPLRENAGIDRSRISYVPWGPELIWAALRGYHWRNNDPLAIGCVGPFNRATTINFLPELLGKVPARDLAYRTFGDRCPQQGVRFDLVGGGEMQSEFIARSNAAMIWHNYRPDLLSMMANWDLYVYPMKDECYCGSEMKVQEALASFVPLILRPSKGLADMGLEQCSFICNDYWEMPVVIRRLLQDVGLRRAYQHRARVYALKNLGAHNSTASMEVIYSSLV